MCFVDMTQTWLVMYEHSERVAENKQDQANSTETIEPGFIDKLVGMCKYRHILRDLKQGIE